MRLEDLIVEMWPQLLQPGTLCRVATTGIKVTHRPTGKVAVCEEFSEQAKNRDKAMEIMRELLTGESDEKTKCESAD